MCCKRRVAQAPAADAPVACSATSRLRNEGFSMSSKLWAATVVAALLGTAALFPAAKVDAVPVDAVALVREVSDADSPAGKAVHDKTTKCIASVKSFKAVHEKTTKCIFTQTVAAPQVAWDYSCCQQATGTLSSAQP
jgi:hypothetical protein